jgi:signal transduction histidine kinase
VRISAKSGADGTVEVVVEDNGPGISDDAIGRVFEYRYRGDVEEEGSGLGLAVSRDALERVGGAIRAEIGSEGGARFVITVPTLDAE